MLKEDPGAAGSRADRWAGPTGKLRGRSHDVALTRSVHHFSSYQDGSIAPPQPGWREMALKYKSSFAQPFFQPPRATDDKLPDQDCEYDLEDTGAQQRLATGSFNGSKRLYS